MKIKYRFKSIFSAADTVTLSSGTEDIITLNKADFNGSWSNALNKDYYISEAQCNNLENLVIKGAEDHNVIYTENTNTKWKEFTKNVVGSKHLSDTLVTSALDSTVPVKIYNQTDFTAEKDLYKLKSDIFAYLKFNYIYDLSSIDISVFNNSKSFTNYYFFPCHKDSVNVQDSLGNTNVKYSQCIYKWHNIPEGITSMAYAFYGCTNLVESPSIPESITNISYAFTNCTNLTKIPNIPKNITNLNYTFSGCKSLIEIPNIPEGITSMNYTFQNCTNLVKIPNIPESVTSLSYAFYGCTSLVDFPNIPESVTNLSYAFYNCTNLSKIGDLNLPNVTDATSIFGGCKSISEIGNIYMPLASMAFSSYITSIGNIDIGSSLTLSKNKAGNITYHGSGDCSLSASGASLGILNKINNGKLNISSFPYTCVAIPYYWGNSTNTLPSSTGYDIWVDYVFTPTDYVHNITNTQYTITENKESPNGSETILIENFAILEKNASYDHTFELESYTADTPTITGTNVTTTDVKVESNNDGTINFTIPCTNIEDNSISSGNFTCNITYVAKIDGYEFHGKTKIIVKFSYTWTLYESVSIEADLVNDDGSDYTEETTDDNSVESIETSDGTETE